MNVISAQHAGPAFTFNDPWWISLIKAGAIITFLLLSVLLALWVERRGLARMQTRPGPNYHGPFGLFQAIGDAAKLILKEDFWLGGADKFIYVLAPVIAALTAFTVYSVIPFGPEVSMFGHTTPLQLLDSPVSVLMILAITAFGVYGIVLGGWSSHSTYPLLGAVRSSAQVISYELSMGMSLLSVFLVSGSMSTSQIVNQQTELWWFIPLFPAFVIYVISMIGEVNRLPFDLPEAEGELVAGHMVEYSSMKFAWFFLAEYINMLNVSAVAATLFLGGWRAPAPLSLIGGGVLNTGYWPILWFVAKVWLFMFFMVWTRGTLLRFRYDQFMAIGWKILIPASLVWIVALATLQGLRQFANFTATELSMGIGVVALIALAIIFMIPEKDEMQEQAKLAGPAPVEGEIDPFAGGYPVPPLPGQSLPPSPRAARRAATVEAVTVSAEENTDD